MQKRFLKWAFVSAMFISTAFAGNTDLLSAATDGAVTASKADITNAKALSDKEMKEVVGGQYSYINRHASTGIVQAYGRITEATYQGKPVYMISEKYGADLSSGYSVYLTADAPSNNNYVYSSRGQVYNVQQLAPNPQTLNLVYTYMDQALGYLSGLKPKY